MANRTTERNVDGGSSVGELVERLGDPRVRPRCLRVVPPSDEGKAVVLVGVVHDHPASVARAAAVVGAVAPGAVALEIPAIAVPFYRFQASRPVTTDTGRELVAAMRAAPDAEVIGIDAPGPGIANRLWGYLQDEPLSLAATVGLLHRMSVMTRRALERRLDTNVATSSGRCEAGHDRAMTPSDQAADELRVIDRSMSFLHAVELPPGVSAFDDFRECYMAARLQAIRRRHRAVAVLGYDHLEEVDARIQEDSTSSV